MTVLTYLLPTSWWGFIPVVVGVFVLTRAVWDALLSPLSAFPGPLAAKVTDFWRAAQAYGGYIDRKYNVLHRKHGSVVRIGPNALSIGDPNLIRVIYSTRNPWKKSDMYKPNDVLINGHRMSNLFNTQDEHWHNQNILPIRPLWGMGKVLEYESLIDETLNLFTGKLRARFTGSNGRTICPIDEWLGYFAWDVTANISFGRHYGFIEQEKDVDNLITDSTKGLIYFAPVSQIPWVDRLLDKNPIVRIGPKPTLTGVLYTFGVVTEYQTQLKEKKSRLNAVAHTLDKYVQLKDSYPDIVDDNQIVNWLMLSILAGGDTTSATMRAVVYFLMKTPAANRKLAAELDAAKLDIPAQWRDIRELPYLDAVIRESMRLNPGIAMNFERIVPAEGFTLPDGRFIPGGTTVGINPAVTNRDPGVFGGDVDVFRPERWLRGAGEDQAQFQARHRRMKDTCDFVFGGGGRICMGRYLAMLEIYKLIATLYSQFEIQLVDPNHEWKYRNAWFVYQSDMPVIIRPRQRD
ncbi:cytochrome P450 [Aspergillus clavatus NRRL 1]|uniref:Benzoate 4-monooxygenase cytochrome P450 n=1 Tax=Aspergillus clavatus (strain ATCC 1007 / CBS 513.65 / DSM 816 / NCTC 3887 / NRRL 1 / QM 1276 / 107) TaxID=344612 RepID=A1C4I0_ASPCL|nr:benzoate 4-monooxygenase cytochrome P450 [Aspergillus clavatus NRRL 1]EAW15320.1 benzoate 4-monooxygenase cytochrome P450 [Aspergillus clavatus NRRL 1]